MQNDARRRKVFKIFKDILHALLGDYHFWVVYYIDLPHEPVDLPENVRVKRIDADTLQGQDDPGLRQRHQFAGPQSEGFGLYVDNQLAVIQWYWWGDRYWKEREGRSWVLAADQVKSVGLYTVPEYRGQGLATLLKRYTAHEMGQRGFRRIYSRIWHSHSGSIAVSRKAGWHKAGSYIEIVPFGRRLSFRVPF